MVSAHMTPPERILIAANMRRAVIRKAFHTPEDSPESGINMGLMCSLLRDLITVLEELHAVGMVHQDIKLEV